MGLCVSKSFEKKIKLTQTEEIERPTEISLKSFIKVKPGKFNSKYRPIKFLGRGAYSKVFMCSNLKTDQKVALKIIKTRNLSDDMLDNNFIVKEAEILRSLDHPNIVKCIEVVQDFNNILLSEEFCQGGSLINYLSDKKEKLSEGETIKLMRQVFSALVYMHERNIVHRDIKLENIFISSTSSLKIKLGDFGCAAVKTGPKSLKGVKGTLVYMAPEIFSKGYDEKVDLWSCGIMICILLLNKFPYRHNTKEKLIEILKDNPLPHLISYLTPLPKDCLSLVLNLIDPNPKTRISAREALNHPWLHKLDTENPKSHLHFIHDLSTMPTKSALKKVFSLYICSFLLDPEKKDRFLSFFQAIDKDGNGTIEKPELLNQLEIEFGKNQAKKITDDFFKNFDLNNNGVIDYTEFLAAVCSDHEVFNDKNIENVLKEVDSGKKGFVTVQKIEQWAGFDCISMLKGLEKKKKIRFEEFKRLLM